MPLVRSRWATVSDGWAPCSIQCLARYSSSTIVEGSVCGLYWPIVSIVRPSRGERLSATTMRHTGFFFEPTRLSLILTAISDGGLYSNAASAELDADFGPRGDHRAGLRALPDDLAGLRRDAFLLR